MGWEFTSLSFIKGDAPYKETGCEGNFALLVDHLGVRFLIKYTQFSSNSFAGL